jgi:hypothetical protein
MHTNEGIMSNQKDQAVTQMMKTVMAPMELNIGGADDLTCMGR